MRNTASEHINRCLKVRTSLVRVERQSLREHVGMKHRRASSAVRHDVKIIRVGLDAILVDCRLCPLSLPGKSTCPMGTPFFLNTSTRPWPYIVT
jgi:hypothetical protein